MKTYFITRFSILDETKKVWQLTKKSLSKESLADKLFAPGRLDEKFNAFEKITHKSIMSQTNKNFNMLVFTSKYLPSEYKNRLHSLGNEFIKVFEVENMNEFSRIVRNYEYEKEYSTVRLDDDDGLNPNFVSKLNEIYEKSNKNEVVSFPMGRVVTLSNNNLLIYNKPLERKNIALGLSKLNGNIYLCGHHTKIHERFNVIYDDYPEMFLLYASKVCDTKRKFNFTNSSVFSINEWISEKRAT
jgi:hypothetical protein